VARSADLNYNQQLGNRDAFRTDFRRGFVAGYRNGYDRIKGRRVPPGYQEPAVARGYSEGYERGLDDGKDHDRYDPVRHSDYREAEQGFKREYGSKDAYRNNYRTGFRQGYEDGYREGARRR
jgi:flagellar biosynthesis/type III secretory pathway protein FliH